METIDQHAGVKVDGNLIVLMLRSKKKMISMRVDEEVLSIIDKFVARNNVGSRTLLLTRLVEGFANGIEVSGHEVKSITLVFEKANGEELRVKIPLDTYWPSTPRR